MTTSTRKTPISTALGSLAATAAVALATGMALQRYLWDSHKSPQQAGDNAPPRPHRATPVTAHAVISSDKVAQSDRLARLRHDVKSALSPALLAADQIATSTDPTVRGRAEQIITAIESVREMLSSRA